MTPFDWFLALVCVILAVAVVILFFMVGRLTTRGAALPPSALATLNQLERWAPKVDQWEADTKKQLVRLDLGVTQLETVALQQEPAWALVDAQRYRPSGGDPPVPPADHCDFGAC